MMKLTSFLIQAILVIVAVLLFSYFDPLGIFKSKKQKLVDTPITVSSIKEIGKFISAEYYGEVLSSLNEIYIQKLDSNKGALQSLDSDFHDAIIEFKPVGQKIKNKNKLLDTFHLHYQDIVGQQYYSVYIDYLKKKYREGKEKNLIDKFVNDKIPLQPFDGKVLGDLNKEDQELYSANKKSLKQQIVLVGRGSVKAGFNFENFTSENFKYDASKGRVYLIGLKPEILSCTINPWFIPDKQVKGFEIVLYTGKADDPKLIEKVKEDCLLKLRQSALERNILAQAKENAVQNLKTFFSLLLDKDIGDVVFADDLLAVYKDEILADSVIRGEDLSIIDTVIAKADKNYFDRDSMKNLEKVRDFIDTLKTKPFYFRDKLSKLNCYSSAAYNINSDWTVDSTEFARLQNLKPSAINNLSCDKYWFHDDTAKVQDRSELFKVTIEVIARNTNQLIQSASRKQKFTRNNTEKGNTDSQKIDSLFEELKK